MVVSDQLGGEYVLMAFPRVICIRVPSPFHKVLEIMASSEMAMIDDGLHLEFFFSINDFWGGSREVVPVLMGFFEYGQETLMEDVMDGPGRGQF